MWRQRHVIIVDHRCTSEVWIHGIGRGSSDWYEPMKAFHSFSFVVNSFDFSWWTHSSLFCVLFVRFLCVFEFVNFSHFFFHVTFPQFVIVGRALDMWPLGHCYICTNLIGKIKNDVISLEIVWHSFDVCFKKIGSQHFDSLESSALFIQHSFCPDHLRIKTKKKAKK